MDQAAQRGFWVKAEHPRSALFWAITQRIVVISKELDEIIEHRNTINYVKAQRLSWFGHTNRMSETCTVKRIHKWKPFTGRPAGRPKSRWEDDVRNDLKKTKLMK